MHSPVRSFCSAPSLKQNARVTASGLVPKSASNYLFVSSDLVARSVHVSASVPSRRSALRLAQGRRHSVVARCVRGRPSGCMQRRLRRRGRARPARHHGRPRPAGTRTDRRQATVCAAGGHGCAAPASSASWSLAGGGPASRQATAFMQGLAGCGHIPGQLPLDGAASWDHACAWPDHDIMTCSYMKPPPHLAAAQACGWIMTS